ncbi:MAG: CocE/NonD family hydrolase [Chthonomonadales bacterium]|nr:CocE/NonD family hydrolase [Chthonomonadales bacterium]
MRLRWYLLVACVIIAVALAGAATGRKAYQAQPRKQTVMLPMTDGVKLATDVYLPEGKGPFPTLFVRTTYNKDGLAGLGAEGPQKGYAVVVQDTRGRFASQGENLPFETDGWWGGKRDGLDTVEWMAQQSWCGKIGTLGGSALGITQLLLAGTGTKRVNAQVIHVGGPRAYGDIVFSGGVFRKSLVEDWLRIALFSPDALKRWTVTDIYGGIWRERDLSLRYDRVNAAAVHVGGWYDIFAQGTIDAFLGYQKRGGPGARGRQKLIMGPWTHGIFQDKAGDLTFRNGKTPPGKARDQWAWFDHHLKGVNNGVDQDPAVTYYTMGDASDPKAPGNEWRTSTTWPPAGTRPKAYYFGADRSLGQRKPASMGALSYVYDPRNPCPTTGGPQLTIPAGAKDQRQVESRSDVLVFSSEPLQRPVEVTGRVTVRLYASSDAPDTDFAAKLCDVYPDGRSFNVCEGILRARFRKSFSKPELMEAGKVYRFDVDLWSTSIAFNKGHRIRVLVTSSNAPGWDPNPNTGEPFRSSSRIRSARNTIYVGGARASHVVLPVMTR